jgi:hypothetical protein
LGEVAGELEEDDEHGERQERLRVREQDQEDDVERGASQDTGAASTERVRV